MINRTNHGFLLRASFLILLIFTSFAGFAQQCGNFSMIDPGPFHDNTHHWYDITNKDNMINARPGHPRYKPTEIAKIADNILLFQKNDGGWPKNYDFFAILTPEQRDTVLADKNQTNTTFDNGNTYTQIAALAIAYKVTHVKKYKDGCIKGIEFVLKSQYANGGWPQYYPIEKNNYSSHITYNDGAMMGVMQLLKDILDKQPQYSFVDAKLRVRIEKAYEKGIDCILKTQIKDDGKLTAWCQQYNEVTLQPAWARKFEPPSICDKESCGIIKFLMSIKHPSPAIVNAIECADQWFKDSKILHTRVETIKAPRLVTPYRVSTHDRIVVNDPSAPPIWARYYELKTHLPIFCNRDSKIVYALKDVARERRDGYGWYTVEPRSVLKDYIIWKKKMEKEGIKL